MTKLQEQMWHGCLELGIRIDLDFALTLASGRVVLLEMHLPDFGGERGILLTESSAVIQGISDEIVAMGFGFAILPASETDADYDRDGIINMLADWTWCSDPEARPHWLPEPGAPVEDNDM